MQFIDLAAQRERLGPELDKAILDVVQSGAYILGPQDAEFEQRLADYVESHLAFEADGAPLAMECLGVSVLGEGFEAAGVEPMAEEKQKEGVVYRWAQVHLRGAYERPPDVLAIEHQLLSELGRLHRCLLIVTGNAKTGDTYSVEHFAHVFGGAAERHELDLTGAISKLLRPRDYVWQGVLHIWIGIDHILFLVALLLPAVLRREDGAWRAVDGFGEALWNVIKIVTLFTLAHSITLALAALDVVRLPGRLVESIIAASIVFVAFNNVRPRFHLSSAAVIFVFGLFHGLGFASVMGELPFRMMHLHKILIAFNVGVELGQLAIVGVALTVLYLARNTRCYETWIMKGGSVAVGLVGAFWLVERAFGLS